MSATVFIKNGVFQKKIIEGETFTLHEGYNPLKGWVTVVGDLRLLPSRSLYHPNGKIRNCRIHVKPDNIVYNGIVPEAVPEQVFDDYVEPEDTEEQAIARINEVFHQLDKFAEAVADGDLTALIIKGAAGIGKTEGVLNILRVYNELYQENGNQDMLYTHIKGAISAPALYRRLHTYRNAKRIVMLDDCEIDDIDTMNLVKAALDTGSERFIDWAKEAHWLTREELPDHFEYNGGMIYLTNGEMTGKKGKAGVHLGAVADRCHYIDMNISSIRDRLLLCTMKINDGMLNRYQFKHNEEELILQYLSSNVNNLRDISLRTCVKLADLMKIFPTTWERSAQTSLMTNAAKLQCFQNSFIPLVV